MALQSDGKILIAGGGTVSRYKSNGNIDTSFGIFGSAGSVASVRAMTIQVDGKIVVAGTLADQLTPVNVPPDGDLALIRYNSDGSVDETFGTHGGVLADFFSAPSTVAGFAVLVQSDGKIVAAGQAAQGANPSQFAVARFTSAGAPDSTFGTGGVVTNSFGHRDFVVALALQSDGKIIAWEILEFPRSLDRPTALRSRDTPLNSRSGDKLH